MLTYLAGAVNFTLKNGTGSCGCSGCGCLDFIGFGKGRGAHGGRGSCGGVALFFFIFNSTQMFHPLNHYHQYNCFCLYNNFTNFLMSLND